MKTLYISDTQKDRLLNAAVLAAFFLLLLSVLHPPQVSRGGDVGHSDYQSQPLPQLEEVQLAALTEVEPLPGPAIDGASGERLRSSSSGLAHAANSTPTENVSNASASTSTNSSQPRTRLSEDLMRAIDRSLSLPNRLLKNGLL